VVSKKEGGISMFKLLNQLTSGQQGTVSKIIGSGVVQRRLFDMGITPGTSIKLEKFAPLGDPMEVRTKGFNLSLRKNEAQNIEIELV